MEKTEASSASTQKIQIPVIGSLNCIDRSRRLVHDSASAVVNTETGIFDACRIMLFSNCKEAAVLQGDSIVGTLSLDRALKDAFQYIDHLQTALNEAERNEARTRNLQLSFCNELRSHAASIHRTLSEFEKSDDKTKALAVAKAKQNASSITEVLATFESASSYSSPTADWNEPVDMNQFLTQIVLAVQAIARSRGVKITLLPVVEHRLVMHKRALGQALKAVLDDMIRSVQTGASIQIESKYEKTKGQGESVISLSVMDNSEALPPQTPDIKSNLLSGLAYTLMREAVNVHRGVLHVNLEGDRSTVYEMRFPGAEILKSGSSAIENSTILIVEDDEEVLYLLVEIVRSRGYKVLTANDGEEALAIFNKERPTLVLADVRMPRLDGIELANAVKAVDPGIPVILFSGQYPTLMEDCDEHKIKADHVLYKPFATSDILESLTSLLSGRT